MLQVIYRWVTSTIQIAEGQKDEWMGGGGKDNLTIVYGKYSILNQWGNYLRGSSMSVKIANIKRLLKPLESSLPW